MKTITISLALAGLLLIGGTPAASAETVRIRSCWDGDTCTTSTGEKIRLACLDTPEISGPRANLATAIPARDYLRRMVVGREVGIRRITTDRYARTVAELYVGNTNVGEELVRSGHARVYSRYAHQCQWSR